MAETSNRIRIDLTGPEVRALVRLSWEAIRSIKLPAELDWDVVCIFGKAVRAAKTNKLDISGEENKP